MKTEAKTGVGSHDLLACACGSEARLTTSEATDLWYVECNNDYCMRSGPERFTPTSAINGWNYQRSKRIRMSENLKM